MFDLNTKEMSYILGLFQSDGNYTKLERNRGRISLELSQKDSNLLYLISNIIPVYCSITTRTRDTNFKNNYESSCLRIFDKSFREFMENSGLISGSKSDQIKPPSGLYQKIDYIRGLYDGDGSVGFTANGFPFVSFVTKSEQIKDFIINEISLITGKAKKNVTEIKETVFIIL